MTFGFVIYSVSTLLKKREKTNVFCFSFFPREKVSPQRSKRAYDELITDFSHNLHGLVLFTGRSWTDSRDSLGLVGMAESVVMMMIMESVSLTFERKTSYLEGRREITEFCWGGKALGIPIPG